MKHHTSSSFWACYESLPSNIRTIADKNFQLIKENLQHPSLHTKKVGKYFSVRIGKKYRALAVEVDDGLLWFWIGIHSEYDRLIEK
jgi:mRNA-degrading endonuclease RelE of RelBE toxin-antitoxin system